VGSILPTADAPSFTKPIALTPSFWLAGSLSQMPV